LKNLKSKTNAMKETERKRDLIPLLKDLIHELVELDKDFAKLEVRNSIMIIRRVKRGLINHKVNTDKVKKAIDDIRKSILSEK
tara:strand:+ start:194 stop:442 length:249 start_codon:yes stop_codon:yes gene_type:complete